MAKLFPPKYQFLDSSAEPLASGTVSFYQNGTSTAKGVFTDPDLVTAATNPANLDSAGRFSQGDLYGTGAYTVVLKNSAGTQVWSEDDFIAPDAEENTSYYELGSVAATQSHPGVITGHIIKFNYLDANRDSGTGKSVAYTGTTTAGKAGDWPNADLSYYDADGKKFDTVVDDFSGVTPTDGVFLVGDGTDFVGESGATARTSMGAQASDAGLTSIAGLTTAADKMIYTTASDTYAVTALTAFARSILDDADEATFKATVNLEIGTDVQAFSNNLTFDNVNESISGTWDFTGDPTIDSIEIGFKTIPVVVDDDAHTFALTESGKGIVKEAGTAATFTIPANASVAFPVGTAMTILNRDAQDITLTITSDTLTAAGAGTTADVTIPQYAQVTIWKVASTVWYWTGVGAT